MLADPIDAKKMVDEVVESEEFRHYLYLFWHWAWLIALTALVTGVVSFLVSRQMTPVFQTSTKLLVVEAASNKAVDLNTVQTSERLTRTYSDMLTNEAVLGEMYTRLVAENIPAGLSISAEPIRDTQLIQITVQGTNPQLIAKVANTLVAVFIDKINAIQSQRFTSSEENLKKQLAEIEKLLQTASAEKDAAVNAADIERLDAKVIQYRAMYATMLSNYEQARLSQAQSTSNVVQVNEAKPSHTPVRPKVLLNTALAAVVGMLLALGFVFLQDMLDDTIKTPDEVTRKLKLPVIGVIFNHASNAHPVAQAEPRSPVSEAFRSLRTNIQYADVDRPIRSLLVTSPTAAEGKTTISTNLAIVLAHTGKTVTIVDADFRRPALHKRMNLTNTLGLTALLVRAELTLDGNVQKTEVAGLSALTSGDLPPNPTELLASKKMAAALEKLLTENDMVVLDSPPVLPVADAAVLAPLVDGVVLVLQPGKTTMAAAKQALEHLRRVNARIIGVVLNNVDLKASRYNYYYRKGYRYYYSSYYGSTTEPKKPEG